MAKPGIRSALPRPETQGVRQRVVAATIETLKREGFAGTSARAISRTGGFSQALVFYHFGSVINALLAALDETSTQRAARYRPVMDSAETLPELASAATEILREDLAAGHIRVLTELIAGATATPGLGPEVRARIEPWIALTEQAITRSIAGSAVDGLVPTSDLAYAIVALCLGTGLLAQLDGDTTRAASLFEAAANAAMLLDPLLGNPTKGQDHDA